MNTPIFTTAAQRGLNWVSRMVRAFVDGVCLALDRCWVITSSLVMLALVAIMFVVVGLPLAAGLIAFGLIKVGMWACGGKIPITSQGVPIGYWRWMTFYPNGK